MADDHGERASVSFIVKSWENGEKMENDEAGVHGVDVDKL